MIIKLELCNCKKYYYGKKCEKIFTENINTQTNQQQSIKITDYYAIVTSISIFWFISLISGLSIVYARTKNILINHNVNTNTNANNNGYNTSTKENKLPNGNQIEILVNNTNNKKLAKFKKSPIASTYTRLSNYYNDMKNSLLALFITNKPESRDIIQINSIFSNIEYLFKLTSLEENDPNIISLIVDDLVTVLNTIRNNGDYFSSKGNGNNINHNELYSKLSEIVPNKLQPLNISSHIVELKEGGIEGVEDSKETIEILNKTDNLIKDYKLLRKTSLENANDRAKYYSIQNNPIDDKEIKLKNKENKDKDISISKSKGKNKGYPVESPKKYDEHDDNQENHNDKTDAYIPIKQIANADNTGNLDKTGNLDNLDHSENIVEDEDEGINTKQTFNFNIKGNNANTIKKRK